MDVFRATMEGEQARFLAVGAANTAIGYLVFVGVYFAIGANAGSAVTLVVAYAIALPIAFFNQRALVFRSTSPLIPEFRRFCVANTMIFVCNLVFLPMCVKLSGLQPPLVQAAFIAVSTVASYFVHKHFSFSR